MSAGGGDFKNTPDQRTSKKIYVKNLQHIDADQRGVQAD